MKTSLPSTPRGQALVLIALAAVGLFAFAALAIDGSRVFSDRRHSQNASDTSALAAALALTREPTSNWVQTGRDRALSNGYDMSDGVTKVYVHLCSDTSVYTDEGIQLTCQGLPTGADPSEYVHVYIKSVVKLFFARVIGWGQIINHTDAVVHASPLITDEWFDGMALVSANTKCPDPGDFGPFETGGSSSTVVTNSGAFVNAVCPDSFVDNGGGTLTTAEGICLVGEYDNSPPVTGISPMPEPDCGDQVDMSKYWMPDSNPALLKPYCDRVGSITGSGGNYEATPGHFGGGAFPAESPSGRLKLQKGIYCFDSGIDLNAGWQATTDWNDNGVFDPDTEGVFFYVRSGDVTFNGGMSLKLYAMTNTDGGFPSSLLHYLMYIPASNEANIVLAGGGDSTFTGMILAPTSNLDIKGDSTGLDLHTQLIALNTRISGNGTIDITYDPADNPPSIILPNISQTE